MARKRINALEVEEIELAFRDKIIVLRFDMESITNFEDLEGGYSGLINSKSKTIQCAKIIYAGAKNNNDNFTYEEALNIVSALSPRTITEILQEWGDSMIDAKKAGQSELQKKLMSDFLEKMFKK